MKNPYPEDRQPNRIENTETGGERLAAKWFTTNDGKSIVTILKDRAYFCVGYDDKQQWLFGRRGQ